MSAICTYISNWNHNYNITHLLHFKKKIYIYYPKTRRGRYAITNNIYLHCYVKWTYILGSLINHKISLTIVIHIRTCSTNIPKDRKAMPVSDISKRSATPKPWLSRSTVYSSTTWVWGGEWWYIGGGGGGTEYS